MYLLPVLLFSMRLIQSLSTGSTGIHLAIQQYEEKICNGTNTCDLVTKVPAEYQNLKFRNCMCDEQCLIYNDCCEDTNPVNKSQLLDSDFVCVSTKFDGSVYMKTSCPQSWRPYDNIKKNCETQDENLLRTDVLISTPVTNTQNRKTYKNLFCALCHNETDFSIWHLGFHYETLFNSVANNTTSAGTFHSVTPLIKIDEILKNVLIDDTDKTFWILKSSVNGTWYKCSFQASMPKNLIDYVRFCVPNVIDTCIPNRTNTELSKKCSSGYSKYIYFNSKVYKNEFCFICNNQEGNYLHCMPKRSNTSQFIEIKIIDERIEKLLKSCSQIPRNNTFYTLICEKTHLNTQKRIKISKSAPRTCYVYRQDTGKICLIRNRFSNVDIEFLDNNTIYLKPYKTKYPKAEWKTNGVQTYVCGTYIDRTTFLEMLGPILNEILIKISIFCLIVHLIIFQQLPEMKNLSGKNLAAFCATLLVAFLSFEICQVLPPSLCKVTSITLHYSLLSCFLWLLVMSYDCWRSVHRATVKLRAPGGRRTTRFLIYCILSWCTPLFIVGPSAYADMAPIEKIPCEMKPGYGLTEECFIYGIKAQIYLFLLPSSVIFSVNLLFFIHTAYIIYISKRMTAVNHNVKHNFFLYARLGLLMGLTWILGILSQILESKIVGLLFTVFNASLGILILCVFTCKQKILKSLSEKHKDNNFIATTLSIFTDSVSETKKADECIESKSGHNT